MIWTRGGRLGVNVRNVRNRLADGHNDVETDDEDDEESARNNRVRGNARGGQGRGRVIRNVRGRARGNRGQRGCKVKTFTINFKTLLFIIKYKQFKN